MIVLSTLCCLGEGIVDIDEVVAEVGYVGADQLPLGIVLQNTATRILGELSPTKILLIARIGRGEHQKVLKQKMGSQIHHKQLAYAIVSLHYITFDAQYSLRLSICFFWTTDYCLHMNSKYMKCTYVHLLLSNCWPVLHYCYVGTCMLGISFSPPISMSIALASDDLPRYDYLK